MNSVEDRLRDLLRERADEIEQYAERDPSLERRARRRSVVALAISCVALSGIVLGLVIGVGSLRQVSVRPIHPSPSPQPTLHRNGRIVVASADPFRFFILNPIGGGISPLPLPSTVEVPNPAGSDVRTVVRPLQDVAWAPDGTMLAFTAIPDDLHPFAGGLFLYDIVTKTQKRIFPCVNPSCPYYTSWSPDGDRLAFTIGSATQRGSAIEISDISGEKRSTVVSGLGGIIEWPTWSPDGRRILFEVVSTRPPTNARGSGSSLLFSVATNGTDLEQIGGPATGHLGYFSASWSPDGKQIAYVASKDVGPQSGSGTQTRMQKLSIVVMNADGSNAKTVVGAGTCYCIGFSPAVVWSPDGTELAFLGNNVRKQDENGLWVVGTDGTGLRLVMRDAVGPIAWQPAP